MIIFLYIVIFILLLIFYYKYIEYYSQIVNKSYIKDFTRWILCDKFVAKEYAKLNGFKIAKTYQLEKYPCNLIFNKKNFVVKPVDLCDSGGVYLFKDNINIKDNSKLDKDKIIKELYFLRSNIGNEYYMHNKMYNGLIPFNGYIIEELLLDENNNIPTDYKCYVFNGKIFFIALTYNRKTKNNKQYFNSVWFDRNWIAIKIPMINKGYKYKQLKKPKGLNKLIYLVEKISKKLKRHCRIDVYLINGDVYFSEFTFFSGAFLHTYYCNLKLGLLWIKYKDNYNHFDSNILKLIPQNYNMPY